ncbi:MAG: hypothetical protein IT557_15275 [Alphaproteobacteria bacterium]|nr:hypothetical protein [Alphaproteobacteria bacterium]
MAAPHHPDPGVGEAMRAEATAAAPAPGPAPAPIAFIAERVAPPAEVSLATLLGTLWRGKWWLALLVAIGLGISSAVALYITPKYTASMLLAAAPDPTSTPGQGGSPVSGLARAITPALAQGGEVSPRFLQMTELMFSPEIARRLDEKHDLRKLAFARRWDAERNRWIEPGGVSGLWRRAQAFFGRARPTEPSLGELERFIEANVTLREVTAKPIWEVRVRHENPQFARNLAAWTVAEADAVLRDIEEKRLDANVRVILQRLGGTNIAEYRAALTSLLALQERQRMLISPDRPFAAEILQEPAATAFPDFPSLGLMLALGPLGGLAFGIVLVLLFAGLAPGRDDASHHAGAHAPP